MKISLLIALCIAAFTGRVEADHHDTYKFSVHQKDYRFSTVFEMDAQGKPHGSVVKSSLRWLKPLRNTYDIYDEAGEWQATGISRMLCLGVIPRWSAWAAEFDVYNNKGEVIGVIDGQAFTTESAKFSIFNDKRERVAYVYLDLSSSGFVFVHPERKNYIIARLTRNFVRDQIDHWDAVVYDVNAIDPAVFKVFAAFAVDYQEHFKADN